MSTVMVMNEILYLGQGVTPDLRQPAAPPCGPPCLNLVKEPALEGERICGPADSENADTVRTRRVRCGLLQHATLAHGTALCADGMVPSFGYGFLRSTWRTLAPAPRRRDERSIRSNVE